MTRKRVRAKTAQAAKNKCTSKNIAVGKVNYIPGTKKAGMKTYDVQTHKRKKK